MGYKLKSFIFHMIAILLFLSTSASVSFSLTDNTGAKENACINEECHREMKEKKIFPVLHAPFSEGDCLSCHTEHSSNTPGNLKDVSGAFCYRDCHEEFAEKIDSYPSVHTPIRQGDCVACHDPHATYTNKLIKKLIRYHPFPYADSYESRLYLAICFDCHNKEIALEEHTRRLTKFRNGNDNLHFKHVNKEPKGRSCKACHDPHAAPQPMNIKDAVLFGSKPNVWMLPIKYVKSDNGGRCQVGCHRLKVYSRKEPVNNMSPTYTREGDITSGADYPGKDEHVSMYKEKKKCADCHEDIAGQMNSSPVKHGDLRAGDCVYCHYFRTINLTKDERKISVPDDICFTCHSYLGKNIKDWPYVHEPVKKGDCDACHNQHGTDNPEILVEYFPAKLYMPFKSENYKLCWRCHDERIALEPVSETVTKFRNGDMNLHYKHVNNESMGRSCKNCHDPHASSNPMLMPLNVEFAPPKDGEYRLLIFFKKTDTGGSCDVGCHKTKAYDRVTPVEYK